MQMAIDVAGFTPSESDELRQAMGSKRSAARMERLRERLFAGMAERGITGEVAEEIFVKMKAFANYGFPESHSVSFAYLVYASSWIKYHEPAAFCAALINAQPMGFWAPHTLVQDARRHGVTVRTPDLNASLAAATLEDGGASVRLGLESVRGVGKELAKQIEAARTAHGPYVSPEDLVRRVPELTLAQLEAIATADAFGECFGLDRRQALWAVGAVSQSRPGRIPGAVTGERPPSLPGMTPVEESVADMWATGVSPEGHPTMFLRDELPKLGVVTSTGTVGARAVEQGDGGGRGHASPAADDRPGRDVPQPRGRDRPDQRRRVEGMLGTLPQGRPQRPGDADPRPARTQRGSDQRRRRAPRPAAAGGDDHQPRLPLTPVRRLSSAGRLCLQRPHEAHDTSYPMRSMRSVSARLSATIVEHRRRADREHAHLRLRRAVDARSSPVSGRRVARAAWRAPSVAADMAAIADGSKHLVVGQARRDHEAVGAGDQRADHAGHAVDDVVDQLAHRGLDHRRHTIRTDRVRLRSHAGVDRRQWRTVLAARRGRAAPAAAA